MATLSSDESANGEPWLYNGHEPATFLQKSLLAVGSAVMGLIEPTRSGWSILQLHCVFEGLFYAFEMSILPLCIIPKPLVYFL